MSLSTEDLGCRAQPQLALAPMAGVTDWPFRLLCARMGAGMVFTEMISAMGYVTAPKHLDAYRFLTATHPEEKNVVVQIFGRDPGYMQEAAKRLQGLGRFVGIDINMGCPARKVTGSGGGCALMKDPALAAQVMRAVRQAVVLPVSVKLRLGWDGETQNARELVRIAAEEGLSRVAIHGRTGTQQYSGTVDRAAIAQIRCSSPLPLLANGDVFTARDASDLYTQTGAQGVMIGRGALGNPWIFRETALLFRGEPVTPPTTGEILDTALEQADQLASWKGEHRAVLEMRKHFSWYLKGLHGAAQARRLIHAATTLHQVRGILKAFLSDVGRADN